MTTRATQAQFGTRPIEIEACAPCNLLWFDQHESTRLAPAAILDLFKYISAAASGPRTALASNFRCPRCSYALSFSHDLQRTTRFTYWRCPRDSGQLMTFQQFLRAKNFVRTPSPQELVRLRETVRQISCSQCGAPIALVDPEGVAKALQDLASEGNRAAPDERESMRTALTDAQVNAIFELERMRGNEPKPEHDLLAIGLGAVGAWLASRLDSL